MQLISFQIKECFGFRDSGRVDLKDPRSFIHILGRNSSGKTSFLTALAHFAPDLIPEKHSHFPNFSQPSEVTPYLIGEYEGGIDDLTLEGDVNDVVDPISNTLGRFFRAKMDSLNSSSPDLTTSTEYGKLVNVLIQQFISIYVPFIMSVERARKLWVRRNASGAYQFSTDQSFKDVTERLKMILTELPSNTAKKRKIQQENGQIFSNGEWNAIHYLKPEDAESLLQQLLVPPLLPTIMETLDLFSGSARLTAGCRSDLPENPQTEALGKIELIADRFHTVARQLRHRHAGRDPLTISDEYDVQDLFHTLLRLFFDDIRDEEWIPSYAGGASRVDFLLKQEQVLVEIKMTRTGLTKGRDISDQLIIDSNRYQVHPDCKMLVAFVYDPQEYLNNPNGIEHDLTKTINNIPVKVIIRSR